MKKKFNKKSPDIIIRALADYSVNSSLNGNIISLFEEILPTFNHLHIKEATLQTISIIKRNILEQLKNYEILAFDITNINNRIIFFIKTINEENKENFLILLLVCEFEIDIELFISSMLNLEDFRAYRPSNSGLSGFYMQDALLKYDFELLTYEKLSALSNEPIPAVEPSVRKQHEGIYFVIKNTLDDPIVFTHLSTDEIDIFNKTLTKADPQAGLLFSLSYNTNK